MWAIASLLSGLFDILLAPFKGMHPAAGLIAISVLTGIVMVIIFGKTSNQDAIRRAKGRLKAHIAEIWLFRNDLQQMILAVLRVLAHTGRYFAHSMRPLIFLLLPVLVIMVMLGVRHELRPLYPGEEALLTVEFDDAAWARGAAVTLRAAPGVEIASPALRIPQRAEIDWKIRATEAGVHDLVLETPRGEVTKLITVAGGPDEVRPGRGKIAARRGRALSSSFLLFPVEEPLPAASGVRRIVIKDWPRHELRLFGLEIHWLIVFFVVSLAAGFSIKDLFGVEV